MRAVLGNTPKKGKYSLRYQPTGAKYEWKDAETQLLRILRNSRAVKVKSGYSRSVGAGFIAEDIKSISLNSDRSLHFKFGWGQQSIFSRDLNLRETEEAIKWLRIKQATGKLEEVE
jgi:hypothetical protein